MMISGRFSVPVAIVGQGMPGISAKAFRSLRPSMLLDRGARMELCLHVYLPLLKKNFTIRNNVQKGLTIFLTLAFPHKTMFFNVAKVLFMYMFA